MQSPPRPGRRHAAGQRRRDAGRRYGIDQRADAGEHAGRPAPRVPTGANAATASAGRGGKRVTRPAPRNERLAPLSSRGRSRPRCSPSPSSSAARSAICWLPVSSLPQVDFPDHPGHDAAAGRQPRDHGDAGHRLAGAPVRPDPVAGDDDLDELVRAQPDHAAVQPRPRHRRRRPGRAVGHQRRRLDAAAQPALSADLRQGEPGRRADRHAGADIRHRVDARAERPRRHADRPAPERR